MRQACHSGTGRDGTRRDIRASLSRGTDAVRPERAHSAPTTRCVPAVRESLVCLSAWGRRQFACLDVCLCICLLCRLPVASIGVARGSARSTTKWCLRSALGRRRGRRRHFGTEGDSREKPYPNRDSVDADQPLSIAAQAKPPHAGPTADQNAWACKGTQFRALKALGGSQASLIMMQLHPPTAPSI